MHPHRLIAMESVRRTTELTRRFGAEELGVFSPAERARFLPRGASDAPINRSLAFELLYRLEPELCERLVAAERIHPAVIEWLPFVQRAVEVGAGTGRLTSHLMTRCQYLMAV